VLGRLEQLRQDENLLYRHNEPKKPTKEGLICTPRVSICLSFNSQPGPPLSCLSDVKQVTSGWVPMTLAPEPAQTAIVRTGVARLEPWPSARRRLLSPRWVFVSDTASSRLKKGVFHEIFPIFKYMNGQRPEKGSSDSTLIYTISCEAQLCCILHTLFAS
jgi:hypothetical protein